MATTFKDYYAILGVPRTATDKEIRAAFRKLARKHHPDVNQGDKSAEDRFKEINEANEVLSDREKQVLRLAAQGLANKQIARRLGISESTVKVHVRNIMHKMGATNRTQAAYNARRLANDFEGARTAGA